MVSDYPGGTDKILANKEEDRRKVRHPSTFLHQGSFQLQCQAPGLHGIALSLIDP